MMLETQMGVNKTKEEGTQEPCRRFYPVYVLADGDARGWHGGSVAEAVKDGARFGIPVTGIKQGALSAAYRLGWVKVRMGLKGAFFIDADEKRAGGGSRRYTHHARGFGACGHGAPQTCGIAESSATGTVT